jgi:hypothetical protein
MPGAPLRSECNTNTDIHIIAASQEVDLNPQSLRERVILSLYPAEMTIKAAHHHINTDVFQVMWELITKYQSPMPPQPQPPYDRSYLPGPDPDGRRRLDEYLQETAEPGEESFKISYCPLLKDPAVPDYDWVDEDLRTTIFECSEYTTFIACAGCLVFISRSRDP